MTNRLPTWSRGFLLLLPLLAGAWLIDGASARQAVVDEARQAGRAAQTFPAADEDYFQGMDGGIALTPDEVKGRDMWLVWTGGDDALWDKLTNLTYGSFDFLKILSSYPGLKYSRDNRWDYLGLVNEPCFTKAAGPDPDHYGLWLDRRNADCPPDPFANAAEISGCRGRCARQEHPARVLLWRADRHCRAAAVPEPRLRRGRGEALGSQALL